VVSVALARSARSARSGVLRIVVDAARRGDGVLLAVTVDDA
jgi:hypothetical protein